MNRKYTNTSDMLKGLGADEEILQTVQEHSAATRLNRLLFALRCKASMTQGELAEKAGCAQSVISRIENASDNELSIGDRLRYVQSLDIQLSVGCANLE